MFPSSRQFLELLLPLEQFIQVSLSLGQFIKVLLSSGQLLEVLLSNEQFRVVALSSLMASSLFHSILLFFHLSIRGIFAFTWHFL